MALSDHRAESPEHRPGFLASFTGRRWVIEMAVLVLFAYFFVFGIKLYIAEPLIVSARSMNPTLVEDERIIVDKRAYGSAAPRIGDIVVFVDPEGGGRWLVKRVVATEGQTVDAPAGIIRIDGEDTDISPETNLPGPKTVSITYPVTVGDGEVFVVGDNSEMSRDSRVFGTVSVSTVSGRVSAVYWPPQAARKIERDTWRD